VAAAVATLGAVRDQVDTVIDKPTTTTTETPSTTTATTPTTSTTSSTTSSTTTPTLPAGTSPPVSVNLVLRPDGLGPFDFGAPKADVLAAVTAELGEPRATYQGGGNRGCQPTAEDVAWIGLILTFEGPDAGSLRLTAWAAALGDNPQQRRNYRIEDGPALGEPLPVWQVAYGSALQVQPDPSGVELFTLNLPEGTLNGTVGPEEPRVVDDLWRRTTECVLGD
jgi:hypothetical protein